MKINTGYIARVNPIYPQGTNSTMFTECCDTAICEDDACCPSCGRKVIGYDCVPAERRRIRWADATSGWKR